MEALGFTVEVQDRPDTMQKVLLLAFPHLAFVASIQIDYDCWKDWDAPLTVLHFNNLPYHLNPQTKFVEMGLDDGRLFLRTKDQRFDAPNPGPDKEWLWLMMGNYNGTRAES